MLRIRLEQEIYLQNDFLSCRSLSSAPDGISGNGINTLKLHEISLKRVRNTTQIIYSTGIAHKLAAHCQLPVAKIADQLICAVLSNTVYWQENQVFSPPVEGALQDMDGWTTDLGLIQFKLSDRAIAAWLDRLIHHLVHLEVNTPPLVQLKTSPTEIFLLQHTYARCCSLLRLACEEGVISLSLDARVAANWQPTTAQAIPWLTAEARLLLEHPAERRLISQLFLAFDQIPVWQSSCSSEAVLDSLRKVSQAFQAFYRDCPIGGELSKSRQRAQARLGLVMATQRIIHLLTEDLLGIYTPSIL